MCHFRWSFFFTFALCSCLITGLCSRFACGSMLWFMVCFKMSMSLSSLIEDNISLFWCLHFEMNSFLLNCSKKRHLLFSNRKININKRTHELHMILWIAEPHFTNSSLLICKYVLRQWLDHHWLKCMMGMLNNDTWFLFSVVFDWNHKNGT